MHPEQDLYFRLQLDDGMEGNNAQPSEGKSEGWKVKVCRPGSLGKKSQDPAPDQTGGRPEALNWNPSMDRNCAAPNKVQMTDAENPRDFITSVSRATSLSAAAVKWGGIADLGKGSWGVEEGSMESLLAG